jgi:hypothetical protein
MPWAMLKVAPEKTLEVVPDNGRRYVVTFRGGEAYLPLHLYNYLIRERVIVPNDKPDLRPRWEQGPGGVNGKPISPFVDYVREVES